MQAVVLVDAAPGYEDIVESKLAATEGVARAVRFKHKNYDLAVLIEADDAGALQGVLDSRLRFITGVRGIERLDSPPADLASALQM